MRQQCPFSTFDSKLKLEFILKLCVVNKIVMVYYYKWHPYFRYQWHCNCVLLQFFTVMLQLRKLHFEKKITKYGMSTSSNIVCILIVCWYGRYFLWCVTSWGTSKQGKYLTMIVVLILWLNVIGHVYKHNFRQSFVSEF